MRICFVSKEVAGVWGAGIGTYVAEAGKALTAAGHEVWLITTDPGEERRYLLEKLPGFHRALVNGDGVTDRSELGFFHGDPHYRYSALAHRTIQATGVTFDYIEFPDYEAEGIIPIREQRLFGAYPDTLLGMMLHSPTWECYSFDQQDHRANLGIREVCAIEEYAIRNVPFRTSPSTRLLEMVSERLSLPQPAGHVVRYPMVLPERLPAAPEPRAKLTDLRFLYYGRIEPRKGITSLVAAFRELPELELTLVGGDTPYSPYATSYREYLKKTATPNVRFLDPMPRDQLLAMLPSADVCIFPSLWENFPNVCIEAMANARVVIGGQCGGMSEMIRHGESGFLVDGSSAADIVRVIREDLAANLERLDEIGRAAAVRIRELVAPSTYVRTLTGLVAAARERRQPAPRIATAKKRVSVVIPFYKDEHWVEEALDSALGQTHRNLEVLIVNDGSPLPHAAALLDRLAAKDDKVRVVHKQNGGLGSARNAGAHAATGDYVLFVDADDKIRPEYAASATEILERRPDLHFLTPYAQFLDFDTGKDLGIYNPMPFERPTGLIINRFGTSGAFFRRSLFVERGFAYDEVLIAYEDWALWMDLARAGVEGDVIPRVLYDYRIRSGSMMSQDGWPNHLALVGLLIKHHFPAASEEERQLLITLNQVWGLGYLKQRFASSKPVESEPAQQPHEGNGAGAPPPPLRHVVVDRMSEIVAKAPVVSRGLRKLLGGVARITGTGSKR